MNARPPMLLLSLALALGGCGSRTVAEPKPPTVPPAPSPTSTITVGFVVQVTSVPTRAPKATPRPPPTPVKVPRGKPFLVLTPNAGPPASRVIRVRGAGLPPSAGVSLVWAALGQATGIGTSASTNRKGSLSAQFTVPASPTGVYDVLAEVNGVPYASAHYTVVSTASLSAAISGAAGNQRLSVHGTHFLPRLHLVLIAYPVAKGTKARYIGTCRTTGSGRLSYSHLEHFPAGQYILRAWSASTMSSQMAETFFQVVF